MARTRLPRYVDDGMMFLSAQNVKPFRFMPENHRKVSHEDYVKYVSRVKPERGDVLLTRVGAMIGEAALIDRDLDFAFYVSLGLLKPLNGFVLAPYLVHWLNSPYGCASSRGKTLGRGHSQGNLNLNLIRRFVLPFPPLEEQRRMVAYLDDLQAKVGPAEGPSGQDRRRTGRPPALDPRQGIQGRIVMATTRDEHANEARAKPEGAIEDAESCFQQYWHYATLWRTWVVGIAAGALFVLLNKGRERTFRGKGFGCLAFHCIGWLSGVTCLAQQDGPLL